jgi:HAD superfamily hydrolase (TIGR01490 family)
MMNHQPIAAIFDVDGTILPGDSMELRFVKFLWKYGELRPRDFFRLGKGMFQTNGQSRLLANKAYLKNKNLDRLQILARDCFEQTIKPNLLPLALERMQWHQAQGHCVVLLSGSLEILVEPLAQHVHACSHLGAKLQSDGNTLIGKILGEHPYDEAKVNIFQALNQFRKFDLSRSFAYGNHYTDRHLLGLVGNPVATNPDRKLRSIANEKGWMIEQFN